MVNELKRAVWVGAILLGLLGSIASRGSAQEEARKVIRRVTPVYPVLAQKARLAGTVRVLLQVTPEGNVSGVRTLGGNPVLATAAEAAAKQWKFEAGKKETSEAVSFTFDRK